MKADAIAQVDERDKWRDFVCDQVGLPTGMCLGRYKEALERKIREAPPVEDIPRNGRRPGPRPKYVWNGIPISRVLTPVQANCVRLKVRGGEALGDVMAWAEDYYGPLDWEAGRERQKAIDEARK